MPAGNPLMPAGNPLMPGGNLLMSGGNTLMPGGAFSCRFVEVCGPFCYHQALKGWVSC